MKSKGINIKQKFSKISNYWSPKILAEMNNHEIKLAKIKGDFIWHSHEETDETFIVIEGEMEIEFHDRIIHLKEGDLFVVPKGVEHKPYAESECKIILLELKGTQNTGNKSDKLTAENDLWVQ
mgnify:FL=1|tara:strand:- start:514 stop:882 length:369 start_codon:yes stop_codon:yes gene_type:complete